MIIMLINLSKLLLCTTLKSFYAVKKVKQTKKRKKRNSLTANHICIDLQFMILKCAALQKLFVIGPFLRFRYCNCCCCNVKPYKFVNADTYITYIPFWISRNEKSKNTCQIAFYVYTKSVYALLHHQRNTPSYIYYSHQKHTPVLLCFDLNYF